MVYMTPIEEINFNYENKEFNEIVYKVIFRNLELKDLNPYFKIKISDKDKEKVFKEINNINISHIALDNVFKEIRDFFKDYLKEDFLDYLLDYLIGYKELSIIMRSDDYEEVMINDYDKVFILSRKNVYYKTNIVFDKSSYDIFLEYIKKTLNNDFNQRDFIDGVLPDNSRINIVSKEVSKFNVITIRKYLKTPLTIVDLIKNETFDYDVAAYLWTIVDGFGIKPANTFICGGTSTGKTTLLNILLQFIPKSTRIIGVEDTREIDFTIFDNYVSLTSNIADSESLYKITANILRMRPDRIIIGETRGKEAKGLFVAMDTGHQGCISTIHANNSSDLVNKLSSDPMNIEDVYLKLLDVIITFNRKLIGNKIYRYISEISEISRMGNITINRIYVNENMTSTTKINIMASSFLESLCNYINISKLELQIILDHRAKILRMMVDKNLTDHDEIREILTDPNFTYKGLLNK